MVVFNPSICFHIPAVVAFSDVFAWRWGVNVPHNKQGFAGQRLRAGAPSAWRSVSLWAGQTHITHLPGKVPPPSLRLQWSLWPCGKVGAQVTSALASRDSWCFGHSLCSSCLLSNASISYGVEHLLSFEDWISIKSPSLVRTSAVTHDVSGWGRSQECPWPHQHEAHSWRDTWTCLQ